MSSLEPNVLCEDYVKKVLQDIVEKQQIHVPEYTICAGSAKGDGFLSFMTKVDVKSKDKDLHLIIKCAPKSEEFRSIVPIRTSFLREIDFYENIYPVMDEFQKEKGIEDRFESIPKLYKSIQMDKEEIIVLENIREHGFQLWDRMNQFDDAHFQMLFKEYAKFHAISFALQHYKLEKYYDLSKDLFDMFTPGIFSFEFFTAYQMSIEQIKNFYQDDEIKRDLSQLKDNVMKYFEHIINNKGKQVVITHGDCWSSNMMFKYNDQNNPEKPTDLRLLDFQLVRKGSPVLDLSNFFYAGAPKHLLNKLDHYLKYYHSVLSKQLKMFGIEVEHFITFEELKNDWKIYSKFGYLKAILLIKGSLREPDEIIDNADLSANSNMSLSETFCLEFKNQEQINERLKDLTDHMLENGLIRVEY
ncbi:PREDICTED: uncharacterized protein LOC108568578 [Nicrophorus vespilloides]|uniref:Uncharacterized protein LOC108568578 n=1 Tax=Nicrophorus vespilloides TaxID=110193 RepID=A0ABM1NEJ3_NICVS|nr:PREDICTED: uncharacterized protein LOC108568578 [Nicrophorus vespilloides]